MENASKALIIAATVLITVLIISVGVYVFTNYSKMAYENEQRQVSQELVQQNTKFEKYIDKTLTIQDILTIANLAEDYNQRKSTEGITVYLNGIDILKKDDAWWKEKLLEDINKTYRIKSDKITEYYEDGTIKQIDIITNNS